MELLAVTNLVSLKPLISLVLNNKWVVLLSSDDMITATGCSL